MHIRVGYDIRFQVPCQVVILALLEVHPSRRHHLCAPDRLQIEPEVSIERFLDSFGNRCCRFTAPEGEIRLWGSTVVEDSGEPDVQGRNAAQVGAGRLPADTLPFLLGSRYCEVDLLSDMAWELFGETAPGWHRVQAICEWVNNNVTFGYEFARRTKTAVEVSQERCGVCRDFQHLAITFCRALNIPARYATGYLGDIGVPAAPYPMDFNAWFEAYLGNRWWTFDARHAQPRIGRVLMATGRDAADVAFTTSFGQTILTNFEVITEEVSQPSPCRKLLVQGLEPSHED